MVKTSVYIKFKATENIRDFWEFYFSAADFNSLLGRMLCIKDAFWT